MVTPTPDPATADVLTDSAVVELWLLVILAAVSMTTVFLMIHGIARTAKYGKQMLAIVATTLITSVCATGAIATEDDGLIALTGVGVGALANSVANIFGNKDRDKGSED